ncbi:conserved protein of unknown function [Ectopseudomonas oleovorans]|uniref:Uncharacterized protein n=1 Tax=Ectopseudomonas oleovorans TaxID=301 RepID=A0A653B3Y6_ECTOL|nr:conserved protein of unknown function [Pseudomonas oleovorans]
MTCQEGDQVGRTGAENGGNRLAIFCAEGFIQESEVPILAAFLSDPFLNRHEVRGGFPFPF